MSTIPPSEATPSQLEENTFTSVPAEQTTTDIQSTTPTGSPKQPVESFTVVDSDEDILTASAQSWQEREDTAPRASSPAAQEASEDTRFLHSKGFVNVGDSSEIKDLTVSGQLPEWLNGEHYTVGPGTFDIRYSRKIEIDGYLQSATATFTFGHWLDGLPLVNRFDLNGQRNTIAYRNRLTSRRLIEKIRDHHGYAPCHPAGLFKTDSNQTVLIKFIKSAAKANKPDGEPCGARILTTLPGVDGRLFCQNMANHVQELDPFDLKPTRILTWDEINPAFKGYNSCPNGQYDASTGEYINYTMEIGYRTTSYHFFSLTSQAPKGNLIASVTAPTGYVNSFSLTKNYIILVVFPLLANSGAVKYAWNESIMDSFSFYPSEPTLFYVISRSKGQVVANYRSDPCFAFHHVNAFEDERDNVVVDMIAYPDDTIAHQLTVDNLRHPENMTPSSLTTSEFRRYHLANLSHASTVYTNNNGYIPTASSLTGRISSLYGYLRGTTTQDIGKTIPMGATGWASWMPQATFTTWTDPGIELPQVNSKYHRQQYTYLYGLGFSSSSSKTMYDTIVKTNVETKLVEASWHEEGCYPSEAVFIPRPDMDNIEDDGALLSVVFDAIRETSFLLVLDSKSMTVLAKADLETIVPPSFAHGSYRLRTEA
ncbi:carotenoid oxygenase [Radiomyces spectabilis]|uniref:carotenoid oxygenase n=1 Tax=Radiomyces spectabilis TaxID=64574 RepID=UPI00221F6306|nr:carotenoid oxygenase [Radiomyces spectabilis]KAI8379443.1 carotenoid oxygenase [Radiomyces spectabilis]